MSIQRGILLLLLAILLIGCADANTSSINRVGLLLEDTIDDQGWNSKGYQGLLNIHSNLNVEVTFKEDMNTEPKVTKAIEEFVTDDVKLIFGHGRFFAEFFTEIAPDYPDVHFVSFNGEVEGTNVTSLHFNSYAMGYFAGMVAAAMSETGHVGAIAAFPWQPEIKGFEAGAALYGNSNAHVNYVEDWADSEKALSYFEQLKDVGVDVFYPAGDGYHVQVIEEARKEGLYAIGFVGDQSDLGESTVLTSTVQHVDHLYELIAELYYKQQLETGNLQFDFADGVISLGAFSTKVPEELKQKIEEAVRVYMETGELPTEPFL
ncbi:BMP family ABC transporter substrate-binding protein [Halalkalibacter alkalisediminis]|uniref:BMP family ABC transporter substrate-binding protein n=1 Tax=Halalkalibacter alkalisediminis TaxID=935616 RepID=A0ABV6NBX5_9BACI|nr:BMP family ABC transporter substrate-binding protein [Halalkalibacter alkalisediminis]